MSFNAHFRRVEEFKCECLDCGEVIDTGIGNLVGHWAECGGKNIVLTSRMAIDSMKNVSDNNKDLVQTIGILLKMKNQEHLISGGMRFRGVDWDDIERVLSSFGYEDK